MRAALLGIVERIVATGDGAEVAEGTQKKPVGVWAEKCSVVALVGGGVQWRSGHSPGHREWR